MACEPVATIAVMRQVYGVSILNRIKKGEYFTAHIAFPGSINAYSYVKKDAEGNKEFLFPTGLTLA